MPVVLVATDDRDLASIVQSVAEPIRNCEIRWVKGLGDLEAHLPNRRVCLVILHSNERTDELLLRRHCEQLVGGRPRIPTLLIRDVYDGQFDLRYLRLGVADCLTRPLDLRRLAYLIDSLTLKFRREEARQQKLAGDFSAYDAVYSTSSPPMRKILEKVLRIASKDVPVLLSGATGTGKTHLANLIHTISPRAGKPFVAVNCGALPTTLIESELFGHTRGAFTGADEDREGKLAYAQDGTIFLDEIDVLSPAAQAKLLRVLDERVFERVGSNRSMPLEARLIVASNRCLEEEVNKGQFRSDLFYRLNVIQIEVPPLRERQSEIRPLVRQFMRELSQKHGLMPQEVDDAVWSVLESYDWPGNIRELRNAVEHGLTLCDGNTIRVEDLPKRFAARQAAMDELRVEEPTPQALAGQPHGSLAQARKEGEYRLVVEVLQSCGNNRSRAARELGISRTALYKKLLGLGIA